MAKIPHEEAKPDNVTGTCNRGGFLGYTVVFT
jgi:hypothetical protein